MTKKEHSDLLEVQSQSPILLDNAIGQLWEIGAIVGVGQICCYEAIINEIMLSSKVSHANKVKALDIFKRWAYLSGRKDERRDTCHTLGISFCEN